MATSAFVSLRRALSARRLAAIEPVLRFEIAVLVVLVEAFVFLQARHVVQSVAERFGSGGVAIFLVGVGVVLSAFGSTLVAARHRRRLRTREGPSWMALPVEAQEVERHLAWDSKREMLWVALPQVAILLSPVELLSLPVWLLVVAAHAASGRIFAELGTRVGLRLAAGDADARPGLPVELRILTDVVPPRARPRLPAPRFRAGGAWRALLRKDALVVSRLPELRQNLVVALTFFAISLLGWFLPSAAGAGDTTPGIDLRNLATFFVTLLAASVLAEWLVLLTGSDPFGAIRSLPLGVRDLWRARVAWAVGLTALLLAGHVLVARGIAPGPKLLFLTWVAGATLGLALLGVHLGLSLFPRTAAARRVLGITLGLMAIVSTAFFLMGWVVLVAAILHSARRLSRWQRAERTEPA